MPGTITPPPSTKIKAALLVAVLVSIIGVLSSLAVVGNTGGIGVYLRYTPRAADSIRAYEDGTPLTVIGLPTAGEGQTWLRVRAPDGTIGWVPQRYTETNFPALLAFTAIGVLSALSLVRLSRRSGSGSESAENIPGQTTSRGKGSGVRQTVWSFILGIVTPRKSPPLVGRVRGLRERDDRSGMVVSFYLDRYDTADNLITPPIEVEMRGSRFEGRIDEGNKVAIPGSWREGHVLKVKRIQNLASGVWMQAK